MSRIKNFKHQNATLTEFQTQVCIGTLLGDASLSRPKAGANFHLSCYHSQKQLDWLRIKWHWLQPHTSPIQLCEYADKRNGKSYKGGRFHTISAPCFSTIAHLFYPNGRKTITRKLIHTFSHPVLLACLICDDGSWDKAGIQIASKQFSEQENKLLALGLNDSYALEAYASKTGGYHIVRIPAIGVAQARKLCFPFIPDSMKYKFGGSHYKTSRVKKVEKVCPICQKTFYSYRSENRKFCTRPCAAKGKKSGYATRTKTKVCAVCGITFLIYNKRQTMCPICAPKHRKH